MPFSFLAHPNWDFDADLLIGFDKSADLGQFGFSKEGGPDAAPVWTEGGGTVERHDFRRLRGGSPQRKLDDGGFGLW